MLNSRPVLWMLLSVGVLTGCQSFTGFDFDSDAIVGGGAVAGKDYITGLQPSLKAREYFVKSNANASQKKTVTPGDDQGTGVVWTDDGGIIIPPGCSIEFENKGYCLDPHLPAPGARHEMQFVRIASLLPDELQGTYRNLLKRSAAGDEDVKNNMQRLVWALRTAGSLDVMATHLTDRQREILSECAEDGSFEDFVYRHELYGKIVEELKSKFINKIKDKTSVNVGGVVYDALDLLNPDTGKQKVEAHLQSLISMGLNLPVTQTGFNYGELENGIYTDIKGNGPLSFKSKIANSTSQPYTFYSMNYAAQVGSGGSSVGFYAAANSGMRQRITITTPEYGEVEDSNQIYNVYEDVRLNDLVEYLNDILQIVEINGGVKIRKVTSADIIIDPDHKVFQDNSDVVMAYETGINKFIFRKNPFETFLYEVVGYISGKYEMCHELSHYVHDKLNEAFPEKYGKLTDNRVVAEGFAIISGLWLSDDPDGFEFASAISRISEESNITYKKAAISFLEKCEKNSTSSNEAKIWRKAINGANEMEFGVFYATDSELIHEEIIKMPYTKLLKSLSSLK